MGSYIQEADVAARLRGSYTQLYALPGQAADRDSDMASAEALVNSYVGKRYTVPVTAAAAVLVLKPLAMDLFVEMAYRRSAGDELPEKVKDAADVARKQLEDIAKGTISLAGASAAQAPGGQSSSPVAVVDGNPPEFKRTQTEGY